MAGLTVQIATRNGGERLERTLHALTEVEVPTCGWKLVVTDSASTDATPDVLLRFQSRLPLTILRAERSGKNHALNLGRAHLEGDLVVFTDDDVIPEPDWLTRLVAAAQLHPEAGGFGGAIRPLWPRPPESWVLEAVPLSPVYSVTDPALPAGPCSPLQAWGPNMMIRSRLLQDVWFREDIGPDGTMAYAMGSETSFNADLARRGVQFHFVPDAIVHHIIRDEMLTPDWILQRGYRFGRHDGRALHAYHGPRVLGRPRYLYRQRLEALVEHLRACYRGEPVRLFRAQWRRRYLAGVFAEAALSRA